MASPSTPVMPNGAPDRRRKPRKLHGFFVGFTLVFMILVLAGFLQTFFIPLAKGTFAKPPIVHLHGALFFSWTFLLVVQAALAATGRLRLHQRVGGIMGWLIIPMLALGTIVAARDTIDDFSASGKEADLAFFYGELADLAMFGLLAGAAMLYRHKPEYHKRWVIMGSLGLLGAAVGRITELADYGVDIFYVMIASVALYDLGSRRRVHVATLMGALVLLTISLSEEPIGNTQTWLDTAHRILNV